MKLSFATLTLCMLLAVAGRAQDSGEDPRITEAKKACLAGDAQKGVRVLADLYLATDDPIWIFNQGRCYQQNNQPSDALSRFKEFLRKSKGGPDDDDVKDAKKYIDEIEADLQRSPRPADKKDVAGEAGASTPSPLQPGATSSAAAAMTVTPNESLTTVPEQSPKPAVYKRWWFWTGAAAVVVAGTVTAILLSRGSDSGQCNNCVGYR